MSQRQQLTTNRQQTNQAYGNYFQPPTHSYIQQEKYGSSFYKDHNEEEYAIQRAFQSNNFNYLRKLPDQIERGAILQGRIHRAKQQNSEEADKRSKPYVQKQEERAKAIKAIKMQQIGTLGYFEMFPYQQSPYELAKNIAIIDRIDKEDNRKKISNLDFRPSGFDKKLHYEDPFCYIDRLAPLSSKMQKQQYVFPFHIPEDTYDVNHISELRQKICQNAARIAGQFLPSNQQQSLSKTHKSKLPQIVKEIQIFLKKFLPGINYLVGINKRDHIQILFEQKHKDNSKVYLIMNGMCEIQNLTQFSLRRYLDRWGCINEYSYLQFVILPPWVKDTSTTKSKFQLQSQGTLSVKTGSKLQ